MAGPGTFSGALPRPVVRVLLPLVPFIFAAAFGVIPLFTAVAILRYRLYDIDRIISRTVSYGAVVAVLGWFFALIVLLPATLVGSRTKTPDALAAIATLVVAAASRPVRNRIQRVVDRRFNRERYDMGLAIDAFAARLRDEVDIRTLRADLETLVHRTMQPAHVSLWLAEEASPRT